MSTNDTDSEDIINIPTSDDDTRDGDQPGEGKYCNGAEENSDKNQTEDKDDDKTISPDTSYSNGMHTSGDDTDSEDDINQLTSDNDRDRDQSGETVNNQDGVNPYVDMPPLEMDESEKDTGGVPPRYTDNSEEDTGN